MQLSTELSELIFDMFGLFIAIMTFKLLVEVELVIVVRVDVNTEP